MVTITNLAIEGWKLAKHNPKDVSSRMAINKFLKHFDVFLTENRVNIVDLTGEAYDPGMAIEVIYTEDPEIKNAQTEIIKEMVRPIIFINNELVKHGQAVTKKLAHGGCNYENRG